jgi:hypothetical protein
MLGLVFGKGLDPLGFGHRVGLVGERSGAFDPAGYNESFALNQQGVSDAVAGAMERSGLRQAPIDNPLLVGCGGL